MPSMFDEKLKTDIRAAADALLQGGVVAFPTETVYGLGADASNPQALRRVFEIKGRPSDHPLIVHIGHVSLLDYWAGGIPEAAWRLASRFWPGPLTLVLPRRAHVSRLVTGGQDTVGLRVPDHPVAMALLHNLGVDKGLRRLPPTVSGASARRLRSMCGRSSTNKWMFWMAAPAGSGWSPPSSASMANRRYCCALAG